MSLKKNTIWNIAGSGVPLIAAAALIPFTLRRLGNESFGVVTLIWALIGYFSLFDMGIGRALTFEMSKLRLAQEPWKISSKLLAGLTLTAAAGLLGVFVMLTLAPFLAGSWLSISPGLQHDTKLAFQIAAVGVLPTTINSGMRGALEGLECFAESNFNKIVLGLSMFILPAWVVWFHGPHLWVIALYLVVARLAVTVFGAVQLRHHLSSQYVSLRRDTRSLLSYGFWVTVTGIVSPLMVYGDRFFVSATVGASQLPLYAIPQEGLQRLLMIPAALCGALLPHLAAQNGSAMAAIYHKNFKRIAFAMFGLCAFASSIAYPMFSWWLSSEFADKAISIVCVLAIGIWLNSMALVSYTVLHALGKPRITAIFHLIELVLYIVALYYLAHKYGLLGAAVAWVLRVLLDLVILRIATAVYLRANTVGKSSYVF